MMILLRPFYWRLTHWLLGRDYVTFESHAFGRQIGRLVQHGCGRYEVLGYGRESFDKRFLRFNDPIALTKGAYEAIEKLKGDAE